MFAARTLEHDKIILELGIEQTAVKILEEGTDILFVSKITGLSK